MKHVLITGVTGQDGAYLSKFLLEKNYKVYGTYRRLSTPNFWRLQHLNIFDKIQLIPSDLSDYGSIIEAIRISQPDEIYHLAAQSFVEASFEVPVTTGDVTGLSTTRFLEAIRRSDVKFYFAATSEMYGATGININRQLLNEDSVLAPSSPYAASKLYGYWLTRIYREGYGIFAVNGILFNHESPLRGLEFVTRKIANEVAKISLGLSKELKLGNVTALRDWGYAPEYVEAMWLMLQQDTPSDYVVATGESYSVQEFVDEAFNIVGLNSSDYLVIDKRFMRPLDVHYLSGDNSKIKQELKWIPKTRFKTLVKLMVEAEMFRWSNYLKGERFPWDAVCYPNEANIITRTTEVY